jgi:hypothetical protein
LINDIIENFMFRGPPGVPPADIFAGMHISMTMFFSEENVTAARKALFPCFLQNLNIKCFVKNVGIARIVMT